MKNIKITKPYMWFMILRRRNFFRTFFNSR